MVASAAKLCVLCEFLRVLGVSKKAFLNAETAEESQSSQRRTNDRIRPADESFCGRLYSRRNGGSRNFFDPLGLNASTRLEGKARTW